MLQIGGFDWDSCNELKTEAKHGISREAIETFFQERIFVAPDPKHSAAEDRFLAIGRGPEGRPIIVAFTFRSRDGLRLIRPISARFMHEKEAKKYEQASTQDEE